MGKILFVDDERLIRQGIADLIDWKDLSGEELELAENASIALKYLEQKHYEIVITDIYMQDINGIELAKQIKDRWPAVKVILLSAYEDFEYAKEAIEAGVFKYLLKPVTPEELEDAVKDAQGQIKSNIEYENMVLKTEEIVNLYKMQMEKNLWKDLAYGNIGDESELETRSRQLGLSLEKSGICCIVLESEDFSELHNISEKAEEVASLCFSDYLNAILINRKIVVLLKNEPSQAELFTFQDKINEYTEETVSVTVGSYVTDLLDLPISVAAASYKMKDGRTNFSDETGRIVLQSIKVIREEIQNTDFNINTIARSLHITPAYFSRIFKKRMGVTCTEFIQNYRVDMAKKLLEFTGLSNQEISEKTGYASVYYFNQQFKKITGEPPGYYRKKRQHNDV